MKKHTHGEGERALLHRITTVCESAPLKGRRGCRRGCSRTLHWEAATHSLRQALKVQLAGSRLPAGTLDVWCDGDGGGTGPLRSPSQHPAEPRGDHQKHEPQGALCQLHDQHSRKLPQAPKAREGRICHSQRGLRGRQRSITQHRVFWNGRKDIRWS